MHFRLACLLLLCPLQSVFAGSYGPQSFQSYSVGVSSLLSADGTLLTTGSPSVCSIQTPAGAPAQRALRLTSRFENGTYSAWKLPVLDAAGELASFTATFKCQQYNTETLADGFSFNVGSISNDSDPGTGEGGFGTPNSLTVAFDTYDNGGDAPQIRVYAGDVLAGSAWTAPFAVGDSAFHTVSIHWDAQGVDITYDGQTVCSNLPVPSFTPVTGDRFAFSARTGGSTQDTFLDDVQIATTVNPPLQTGGPVITEMLADNSSGMEDEDGDTSDWVEIYNGSGSTANLTGWRITNSETLATVWTFPNTTLQPFSYLRVFASGKNRSGPPLHTAFKLEKSGGYLALLRPDGTTASVLRYPAQFPDISFGTWGAAQVPQFFSPPSPANRNESQTIRRASNGPAEDVVFNRAGGLLSAPAQLSITPPTGAGAVVRFTTDGTPPTESSPAFALGQTLSITDSIQVRARVFAPDRLPGKISGRNFLMLDSSLSNYGNTGRSFSSNLPILVVESWGSDVDSTTSPNGPRPYRPVYSVLLAPETATGNRATLDGPVHFEGRGGMHVRGQTSSGFPQKPYAWEIWNQEDQDRPVSLLGMPADGDWVLQTTYNDKSFIRNMLPYTLMREFNGTGSAMRARFVEVFFNQDGGPVQFSDYRGVYVLMERIERGSDRIPLSKLSPLATDPATITGGYIFKKDKVPVYPIYSTTSAAPWGTQTHQIVEPASASPLQVDWLRNHVQQFDNALAGASFADPSAGYRAYIDPMSFMDNHIWVEAFKQIDGYRLSTYYTKNRNTKIRALPIWDYNLSSGNADYLTGDSPTGWYYSQIGGDEYPYYPRLFEDPLFTLAYWDRYWKARRSVLSEASIQAKFDSWTADLTDSSPVAPVANGTNFAVPPSLQNPPRPENAASRHFNRWPILGTYVWPNPPGYWQRTTFQSELNWMRTWLSNRLAWFDSQFTQPPGISPNSGNFPTGTLVTLTNPNPSGTIFYTTDGSDPLPPASTSSTDLVGPETPLHWLVPSAANGGLSLTATAGPNQWTGPAAPPNIAQWQNGLSGVGYDTNPAGTDFSPFIRSNTQSQMSGLNATCYIRIEFQIPDQAALDAIQTLRLEMRFDDGYRAFLNGTTVHGVNDTDPSVSTSPASATASALVSDAAATVYQTRDVTDTGKPALRVGTNVLAIHGLNASSSSSDFLISPKLVALQAAPPSGSTRTYSGPFPLQSHTTVKARVFANNSMGPLSEATFVVDATPPSPQNLAIAQICYDPLATPLIPAKDLEFVVLRNIGNTPVNLSGLQFTAGIRFTFTGTASQLSLAPGAECVLASNPASLQSHHGPPPAGTTIFGPYEGALDNSGELLSFRTASNSVIREFQYSATPPWPIGSQRSIVLLNPASNPNHADGHQWRSGTAQRGTPYTSDSVPFQGNWQADSDGDGFADGTEYALGSDPSSAASVPALQIRPNTAPGAPNGIFQFSFRRSLANDQCLILAEISNDLANWTPADLARSAQTLHPDQTVTETWSTRTPQEAARVFLRLKLLPR